MNKLQKKYPNRVLIIGDTHCPFDLPTYLDFLIDTYHQYDCNKIIHIGDEADNHAMSYHESIPELKSAGDELYYAKKSLQRYYKYLPKKDVTVIIGNHTRMVMRKAMSGNIPKEWIRDYNDVLGVPKWEFVTETIIDDVLYAHGEGGTARTKCRADLQSCVQGHLHTQLYSEVYVGRNRRIFGMQVGCGIDHREMAFNYAKSGKRPAIGCGVVLHGTQAIAIPMPLELYKKTKFK